jgi:hypothetical protein
MTLAGLAPENPLNVRTLIVFSISFYLFATADRFKCIRTTLALPKYADKFLEYELAAGMQVVAQSLGRYHPGEPWI